MGIQSTSALDRVVVGIDGSLSSQEALEWALRYASATGSTVEVVAAWDWPVSASLAPIAPGFEPKLSAEQLLDDLIQQKKAEFPNLPIKGQVVQGDAAAVLEEASIGATLLVVATRGHGEITGLLLGSVSEHCITHAHCPVVVYRGERDNQDLTKHTVSTVQPTQDARVIRALARRMAGARFVEGDSASPAVEISSILLLGCYCKPQTGQDFGPPTGPCRLPAGRRWILRNL